MQGFEYEWTVNHDNKQNVNTGFMLDEIVNTKFLNTIHERFVKVTGVRCFITNTEIRLLSSIANITDFCKLVRSCREGRRRCAQCCKALSQEAKRKGEAVIGKCHAGLIYAVSPIIVNNQHVGSFYCGQILPKNKESYFDDIKKKVSDLNLDGEQLECDLQQIEVVSQEKLMTALEMLTIMTNYIAEMGVANIAQQQLMAEMKAKAELEKLLRETEYKTLQAQINPHFLFNCLNTISQVALIEGASKTQDLIYAISDILRSLLKHPHKIITLREELEYVKDYLLIQQARFGDRIKVNYKIDDETLGARLPRFTLQPLVENAMVHGLEPKIEGGTLTIEAQKCDQNVIIDLTDTGVGIPDTKMNNILKAKSYDQNENVTSLGINNVHQRIQYYFGSQYGLNINSTLGKGCQVTVTVPFSNESTYINDYQTKTWQEMM